MMSVAFLQCFPKFQEQSGQRVEFFPVEWRAKLRLDEGLVDAITPQRILGLRYQFILLDFILGTLQMENMYNCQVWNQ